MAAGCDQPAPGLGPLQLAELLVVTEDDVDRASRAVQTEQSAFPTGLRRLQNYSSLPVPGFDATQSTSASACLAVPPQVSVLPLYAEYEPCKSCVHACVHLEGSLQCKAEV